MFTHNADKTTTKNQYFGICWVHYQGNKFEKSLDAINWWALFTFQSKMSIFCHIFDTVFCNVCNKMK